MAMCDTCHAGCCRAYNLFITAFDALRIASDLKLPIAEFTTLLALDSEASKRFENSHVPIRFSDPGCEDTRFFIMLKRVESKMIPGTVKCYFLQEWQRAEAAPERANHPGEKIAARCGAYMSRPLMCRTYPTSLDPKGSIGFVSQPAIPDLAKQNPIYTLCPENWTNEGFSSDATATIHNLVLNRYEFDFQNRAISEWNMKPQPLREFFPFMDRVYKTRFRTAVTTPPPGQAAPGSPAAAPSTIQVNAPAEPTPAPVTVPAAPPEPVFVRETEEFTL